MFVIKFVKLYNRCFHFLSSSTNGHFINLSFFILCYIGVCHCNPGGPKVTSLLILHPILKFSSSIPTSVFLYIILDSSVYHLQKASRLGLYFQTSQSGKATSKFIVLYKQSKTEVTTCVQACYCRILSLPSNIFGILIYRSYI